MSGASQTESFFPIWNASNSSISACDRRLFGVTTVTRAACPSASRAKSSDLEITSSAQRRFGLVAQTAVRGADLHFLEQGAVLLVAGAAEALDHPGVGVGVDRVADA